VALKLLGQPLVAQVKVQQTFLRVQVLRLAQDVQHAHQNLAHLNSMI
jgi:hypothetical protein